jgi:hypothetical protein
MQLQDLFERAKITEVKTDPGMRPAHPHQLREMTPARCGTALIQEGAWRHGRDGGTPISSVYRRIKGRARRNEQTHPRSGWSGLSRLAVQSFADSSGDGFGNPHGLVLALESALRPFDLSGRNTLRTPGSFLNKSLMH